MNTITVALKKVQTMTVEHPYLSFIIERLNASTKSPRYLMLGIEAWAELYNLSGRMPAKVCKLEWHVVPTLPPTAIVFGD